MLPTPEAKTTCSVLAHRLVARDWQEAITFSFVNSLWEAALHPNRPNSAAPIAVLNPIARHHDVMRTTLAGGLVDVLRTNLARRHDRIRVFEIGRCFLRTDQGFAQPQKVGGLAYGNADGEQWGTPMRQVDLFDVKADLQALVWPRDLATERGTHPALHPGRAATVTLDGKEIGWLGELHPRLVGHFELPRAPILFELDIDALGAAKVPVAQPISRLPVARRDLAIVVDDALPAQTIIAALRALALPQIDTIRLFDVYRGAGLPRGKKSLAILVLMQDTERTLTDAEMDAIVARLLRVVADNFGGSLRQQDSR
jgi:phenylalanyl-tRNA synthetase beta chain